MKTKFLVFKLFGKFAHFSDPLTSPKYLKRSFNIIPKPTLLGLLGSILGYNGYANFETTPEFYQKLENKKIFIIPQNKPVRKILVKYNSLNSFVNNDRTNPNVMMQEEILLEPSFLIGIEIDEVTDSFLIEYITKNKSHYQIYLGKNEFFANIKFRGIYDYKPINSNKKEITIHSIFPINILEDKPNLIESIVLDKFISKIKFDEKNMCPIAVKIAYLKNHEESIVLKTDFLKRIIYVNNLNMNVCLF